MTHPFLDAPTPLAFAHRGGTYEAPENTMAAFEYAVGLGYRYLELDVRATADGRVVVFHDADLDRVTDHTGALAERRWDELAEVRVDGSEPIPLLEEVLTTWPGARVNIDPKSDDVVEPLVALLRRLECLERVCVMAFSDRRLNRVRRLAGPELCTALGPESQIRLGLAAKGVRVGPLRGDVAQVPASLGPLEPVDARFVRVAHDRGLPVHAWVVDYPGTMERLLDLGVDGLMTDRPSKLKEVLVARGAWRC